MLNFAPKCNHLLKLSKKSIDLFLLHFYRLVIMSLVDIANGKSRHVPYRDSRLTFLLQVLTERFMEFPFLSFVILS
jgi:hypothetical protein